MGACCVPRRPRLMRVLALPGVQAPVLAVRLSSHIVSRPKRKFTGARCFREGEKKPVSKDVEQQVQKATHQVSRTMTGFLSSSSTQSNAYWLLGTVAVATAASAILLPGQFAGAMFKAPTDSVVNSIVRSTGAVLLTSAAVKYTLKEASVRGQLYMDTFQRLNIGLILQTLASLVVLAQAISLRNPALTGFVGTICGLGLLVSSRVYSLNKDGFPFPSPVKTLSGAISVLMPRNGPATMYSLLTVMFAGMAAMTLGTTPGREMVIYGGLSGPLTVFMHRVTGAGMLLMTLVAYSLKDGADREKLGATTFRWLNLGVSCSMLVMAVHMTVDWQNGLVVHGPKAAAMMAAQWIAFMWTSYMYIAGESKQKQTPPAVAT